MRDGGLAIVLGATAERFDSDEDAVAQALRASRNQADELDHLLADVEPLGVVAPIPRPTGAGLPKAGSSPVGLEWEALVRESEAELVRRGTDPRQIGLEALIDPVELAQIERRFSGSFELRCDLDRYDVTASIMAGLVAALVDFLIVRIPGDTLAASRGLRDGFLDKGSPLTKWMKTHSFGHDNALSHWAKVSFDRVDLTGTGKTLAGSGGKTHRYHTVGHDPVLGLVFGTIDIMRGGLTGIDNAGHVVSVAGTGPAHPFLALPLEILHLMSDAPTAMGIPVPGWVLTGLAQFGSIGPQNLSVAEVARQMYVAGYDSRHFLTMATSPAAAELTLRGYWGLRRYLDPPFVREVDHAAVIAETNGRVGAHPRFVGMTLVAHIVACAANAGKIAMYGPAGPLAFNEAQWLAFLKASIRILQLKTRTGGSVIAGHALANANELAQGWPTIDWNDDAVPALAPAPNR